MKIILGRLATHPAGILALLTLAAFLEACGDSLFQSGLHRSSGSSRICFLGLGVAVLAVYGFTVNIPEWEFGRLIGSYVAVFFLAAQVLAWVRFRQAPTPAICAGEGL